MSTPSSALLQRPLRSLIAGGAVWGQRELRDQAYAALEVDRERGTGADGGHKAFALATHEDVVRALLAE